MIDEAVSKRVERLCYGNLDDWRTWFQRAFGNDLAGLALNWEGLQEVIQRRHVVVHNGGRASRLYIERLRATDVSVNDRLEITPKYTFSALDECTVLGLRMLLIVSEEGGLDARPPRAARLEPLL